MSFRSCPSFCRKLGARGRSAVVGMTAVLLGGMLGALALADPPTQSQQGPPLDSASPQQLLDYLAQVPAVTLDKQGASPNQGKKVLEERMCRIKEQNKDHPDGFVRGLLQERSDLAGLPFVMGKACNLGAREAKTLASMAENIRSALRVSRRLPRSMSGSKAANGQTSPGSQSSEEKFNSTLFWGLMVNWESDTLPGEEAVRAMQQMLIVEDRDVRLSYVQFLNLRKGKVASAALAQRVLFDLDVEVRTNALAALKGRLAEDYSPILVNGLRYPWAAVADRAAKALVALKVKQAVPDLLRLLDEPEPDAPFLQKSHGKQVPVVRELVRVSHLSNCLLCHPGSADPKDPVRGRVPIPGEPLISPSMYGSAPNSIFVRADVTYLRPDFSVMQTVPDHGVWPTRQRFDYLVRTRPLMQQEQRAWQARKKLVISRPLSAHRRAILFALRELTGQEVQQTGLARQLFSGPFESASVERRLP